MAGLKTILCIEDEHFISELYARALRKAGYEVTIMLSGSDGLVAAQTDKYDLILLDLMTPGLTGIEILSILRDPVKTPKLHSKIIITTNLDQEESMRGELERTADGYLIKAEITPRQLVGIVEQMREQITNLGG
jgi:DNA-binding response OmpR family regulator